MAWEKQEIIMIHDCAFVGYELKKELLRKGFNVKHFFFKGPPKITTLKMIFKLKRSKSSLLHAHFCRSSAYAAYFSGKPYIVHCHGSDIRWGINWLQKKCLNNSKVVLVSTPDLLNILPHAIWLPNPIDTKRFKPLREHYGNNVLYFAHSYEDISVELKRLCDRLGFNLRVQRIKNIPYFEMHKFLNEFDIFVDRFLIKSYSKTALEAMACGIPVIGYKHNLKEILERLTDEMERRKLIQWQFENIIPLHRKEKVVEQLIKIYNKIIEDGNENH